MPQDDMLLSAILADPDNDSPRLAYAARMDAERNQRGAFIRLQLALARFDAARGDPIRTMYAIDSQEYLDQFGSEWAAPIASLVPRYEFHRGFVSRVKLAARDFLDRAPQLFALAPIQHLDLTDSAGIVRELFDSPYLDRIRSLDLAQNSLTDADVKFLADSDHVSELRWLSLAVNNIHEPGLEFLAASKNLPQLRFVNFTANPVDPGEQYAYDQGLIVDKWLPEAGIALERKYGVLPWLHFEAQTSRDFPPSRFIP